MNVQMCKSLAEALVNSVGLLLFISQFQLSVDELSSLLIIRLPFIRN